MTKGESTFNLRISGPDISVKLAVKYGILIALFFFIVFAAWELLHLFIPYFTSQVYVNEPIFVSYTPDKYVLSVTIEGSSPIKDFDEVNKRANDVKLILLPYFNKSPTISPYIYKRTRYVNRSEFTEYVLSYTISGELKTLDLPWERLSGMVDRLSLSFQVSDELRSQMEEEARIKAVEKLDKKADELGREKFLIYFGKKLLDESVSCGYRSSPPVRYNMMAEAGGDVKALAAPNPQPGEEERECGVTRTYTLYGFGIGKDSNYD